MERKRGEREREREKERERRRAMTYITDFIHILIGRDGRNLISVAFLRSVGPHRQAWVGPPLNVIFPCHHSCVFPHAFY